MQITKLVSIEDFRVSNATIRVRYLAKNLNRGQRTFMAEILIGNHRIKRQNSATMDALKRQVASVLADPTLSDKITETEET